MLYCMEVKQEDWIKFMPDSSYFVGPQAGLPAAPMGQFMPIQGQFKLNQDALNKGIQNVTGALDQGAAGPFKGLWNYLGGTGALNVGDDTGTLSLSPGGSFNLRSPQGFGITGNPAMKSLGVNVPVNVGDSKGTVGLQGSWGVDPSIQANFAFGGTRQPVVDNSEQQLNAALGLNQQYNENTKMYSDPYTSPEPSARTFLNEMIDKYRGSGGRDPNSPSSWQ